MATISKISRVFYCIAIIGMNLLAIFVLVNALIWGHSRITELRSKHNQSPKDSFRFKAHNEALKELFPQLTAEEINDIISSSRRLSQLYDSFTQFKEGPYESKFVNVDPNGFRLCRDQAPWPPPADCYVIFFFGGSTSFGYGVQDDQTVASHLQGYLRRETRHNVSIYNFGRAYYFSSQERTLLEKLLLAGYMPNMVIFMDGLNEFIMKDGEPAYTDQLKGFFQKSEVPLIERISENLPVTRFIRAYRDTPRAETHHTDETPAKLNPDSKNQDVELAIMRYMTNKRIIEAVAKEFGITPVFVWQPVPFFGYDGTHNIFKEFDYATRCGSVKTGYESVSSNKDSLSRGNNFIWLGDMQRDMKKPLYVSALHYSPEMSRNIAKAISDHILTRNLLTTR